MIILVCKATSHSILEEYLVGIEMKKVSVKQERYIYEYRYTNSVPLNNRKDSIMSNWMQIIQKDKAGNTKYSNCFITSHLITQANVVQLANAGRRRWRIENENNNTLKTRGYRFEHNYGHGKENLASVFATLTCIAFAIHNLLDLIDLGYQNAKLNFRGSLINFFNNIKFLTRTFLFNSWDSLMIFIFKPPDYKSFGAF